MTLTITVSLPSRIVVESHEEFHQSPYEEKKSGRKYDHNDRIDNVLREASHHVCCSVHTVRDKAEA